MKKENNLNLNKNKFIDKNAPLPLVPAWILLPLWCVSLALPNLIYSGVSFADTLHIIKWTVTGVPVAIALFVAGIRLAIYGPERVKIKFDIFSIIWAIILIYCLIQQFWVKINSPTGYALEMTCFAAVWAFYVLTSSSFPDWGLRTLIILGNVNASINIFYAELQSRHMNNLEFLRGTIFEDLIPLNSWILPTPGNYIGNTAQQNMFGLWIAISVLGAIYLFVFDALKEPEGSLKRKLISISSLFFAGWGSWGLINSTSRSAILALLTGLIILFVIAALKFERRYIKRFLTIILLAVIVFSIALSIGNKAQFIIHKTKDIIENYQSIGMRRGIWATSYGMLKANPQGVGIGQYKWHYLDGQREAFKIFDNADWMTWQYTHWAHNEFLQFFCEGGYIGGILFLLMYSFWLFPGLIGLKRKKEINSNAVWAFALVSVITFAAVFTRPFHRIENMVWITLAFAISNREFFPALKFKTDFNILKSNIFARFIGIIFVCASIAGCVYIWSGIRGNYLLRMALSTHQEKVQLYYLEQAEKHPIVYEETMRNLAHHYLQIGEQTNNIETIAKGFNILWEQFHREPHSEDIGTLLNFAQRFQLEPILRELKDLFKPGTYHLQRVPQINNNNGQVINALLLINGPGSDDE